MHHVARLDWSFADAPTAPTATASGLARHVLVGAATGAVHTELAARSLRGGGWLARPLPKLEEAL